MSSNQLLDWEEVDQHPDPATDLGYEIERWEAVEAQKEDEDLLLFLPSDEELLKVDAFVVASLDAVKDLEDHV